MRNSSIWPCLLTLLLAAMVMPSPAVAQGDASEHHYEYDAAGNLLAETVVLGGVEKRTAMPRDGSGRNRPASVGGVPLEWNAAGNLVRKGPLRLFYDERNRLILVTDEQGEELARYTYDPFNRRLEERVGSQLIRTVWDGLRPVETSVNGFLTTRRAYGLGLDEVVRVERDGDGDGTLEQSYVPLYDGSGHLVVAIDSAGKPLERYAYSPYGHRSIYVDLTPPRVEQVRVVGSELWLELSETIDRERIAQALRVGDLRIENTASGTALTFADAALEVHGARRHRLDLTFDSVPAAGTALVLQVSSSALSDIFANQPSEGLELPFTWPAGDAILYDDARPEVFEVRYRDGGWLELEFTEEVNPSTATTAIQVSGMVTTWSVRDRYRLVSDGGPIPDGTHELLITLELEDLAGKGLEEPFTIQLHVFPNIAEWINYRMPDSRLSETSTIDNPFGFHGQPHDPVTGFVYMRNRYYDPDLGRFITPDPLGYVDGPNPYQYGRNSPVDWSDPLGLESSTAIRSDQANRLLLDPATREAELARRRAANEQISQTLSHPNFQGSMQIAFGCGEAVAGAVSAGGSVGLGAVPGFVMMVQGADTCGAGVQTLRRGEMTQSLTYQGVSSGLEHLGVSPETADFCAGLGEICLAGGASAVAMRATKVGQGTVLRPPSRRARADFDAGNNVSTGNPNSIELTREALPPPSRVPNAAGRIVSFVTPEDRIFYRVFSGDNNVGAFLTSRRPGSKAFAQQGLDLPPGNTADFVQEVLVPAGTRLQRSRVRPGGFGGRGGAEQFELLEFIPVENFGPGVPLP